MIVGMKTVVLGEMPPVLASLVAQRKQQGLDRHDEIWNGDYHMSPAASFEHGRIAFQLANLLEARSHDGFVVGLEFNLGNPEDFRIPDLGLHRGAPEGVWHATAAMVVEVRSPHDETFEKFGFYFDHGVEEVLVVDLPTKQVSLYARSTDHFVPVDQSALLPLAGAEISELLRW
jgi:Uma2 family endonuclease